MSKRSFVIITMGIAFASFFVGYEFGSRSVNRELQSALLKRDEEAQLQAAKSFLQAYVDGDWQDFMSSGSGRVCPSETLDRRMGPWLDVWYGRAFLKSEAAKAQNIRLGPVVSRKFLHSARDIAFSGDEAEWYAPALKDRPPRLVLYDIDATTYCIFVVWENGGWRAVGHPVMTRPSWATRYDDYIRGSREDPVPNNEPWFRRGPKRQ